MKDYILQVKEISKTFPGEKKALNNVSFSLPYGRILGVVGENGAGKTTLIRCILNSLLPDKGMVMLFGEAHSRSKYILRQKIGAVYDENCFFDNFTADDISLMMEKVYIDWDSVKYATYREQLNIPGNIVIGSMSKGTQVKLGLAIALSHSPKLLILDEITSCLDPLSRCDVLLLFKQYVQSGQNSILFSTHATDDLEKIADNIIFVVGGEIVLNVEMEELKTNYGLVRCSTEQYQQKKWETGIACFHNSGQVDVLVPNLKDYCKHYCVKKPTIDEVFRILARGELL